MRLHPKVTGTFKVHVLPEGGRLPKTEIVEEPPTDDDEGEGENE